MNRCEQIRAAELAYADANAASRRARAAGDIDAADARALAAWEEYRQSYWAIGDSVRRERGNTNG